MAILRDLAETFNQLDKDDLLRAEIITNVASKYHASKFSALLQNMDMLDKMLVDYSEGSGSAMEEANKSAQSLSGSINSLSNSWNELVNTFVNTDELKGAVNILDNLLQSVTSIVDKLGMSGTAGLGAGLFAGIKDIGIFKTFDSGIDKISSKWGMFGRSFNDIGSAISGRIKDINHAFQATDDLIGSIKDSDSIWKRLYPGKESIKSKLIDVDATIPKLSIEDASNLTKQIREQLDAVNSGSKSWEEYFKILKDNNQNYVVDLIKNTNDLTKLEGQDLVNANQKARASALAHNEAIKAQTLSVKAGQVAFGALKTALNAIAFTIIIEGISRVVNRLNELSNAAKNATEKGQEFASSLKGAFTDESKNISKISELNDEYQKLSKGVDSLGRNVSSTTPKYGRYKEVIAQIHEIMPDLNMYFNDQGEAIGFVGGKLEDVNKKYREYLKNQADEFHYKGDENGNTPQNILDEYSTVSNWQKGDNWFDSILMDLTNVWKRFTYDFGVGQYTIDDAPEKEVISKLEAIQNKTKEEVSEYLIQNKFSSDETDSIVTKVIENMLSVKAQDINSLSDEEFNFIQQNIVQQIENLKGKIENKASDMRQLFTNELNRNDTFFNIDESGIRDNITSFVSCINSDMLNGIGDVNLNDINSIDLFIDKIVNLLKDNPEFSNAWEGLFNIDENIPVNEYIEKVQNYINIIADSIGLDKNGRINWMISLGFDVETDKESILALKHRLSSINGGAKDQSAAKWVDSLTKDELKFAQSDEFVNAIEEQKKKIGEASLTARDYENALNGVKKAQSGNSKDSLSFSKILSDADVDDYQKKISSLESYLEKFKSGEFSSSDKTSLLTEFGIVADSAEEAAEKIQKRMDKVTNSIVTDLKEILNGDNISEATRKK